MRGLTSFSLMLIIPAKKKLIKNKRSFKRIREWAHCPIIYTPNNLRGRKLKKKKNK